MAVIHFLNVLEGDCNVIQHDSGRLTVIDVSNAFNDIDTEEEKKVKTSQEREDRRLRTQVPTGKTDYKQKHNPDNPCIRNDFFGETITVSGLITGIDSDDPVKRAAGSRR